MSAALWCILVAIAMPYVCFGIARNRARKAGTPRDNARPREFPARITGVARRAWDAHLNAFESLPGFAAAVVVAHLAHAPQDRVDALAVAWVVARVAYIGCYLADENSLRSAFQFASLACVLGLFAVSAGGGG